MSDQDKITSILQCIQDDSKLLLLMRIIIKNNIGNVSSMQLDVLMGLLGITNE